MEGNLSNYAIIDLVTKAITTMDVNPNITNHARAFFVTIGVLAISNSLLALASMVSLIV